MRLALNAPQHQQTLSLFQSVSKALISDVVIKDYTRKNKKKNKGEGGMGVKVMIRAGCACKA